MKHFHLAGIAFGAALLGAAATADAAIDLGTVAFGATELDIVEFADAYDDQVTFTTLADGSVEFALYGLTDTIQAVAAAFEAQFAVGIGNIVGDETDTERGTAAILTLAGLKAGTYSVDITASTTDVANFGFIGTSVTLTPIPAAAFMLLPALAGLGFMAAKRRH